MMCTAQQQGKYLGKVCDTYYAGGMLRSEYTHTSRMKCSSVSFFITRAWKHQIRSVKAECQQDLYQTLCLLESEPSVAVFLERLAKFLQMWRTKEPNFVAYFPIVQVNRKDFMKNQHSLTLFTEKWARC